MLEQKIEDLTRAVETLTKTIAAMSLAPATDAPAPKPITVKEGPSTAEESAAPSAPSEQDLKDLTLARSREGHKDAIRDKLTSLNVKKLGDLKGAQAAEFYQWLKKLGGN